MPTLDRESRQLINKARNLGGNGPTIYLEDHELLRLCVIVAHDLNSMQLVDSFISVDEVSQGYYGTPLEWFRQPVDATIDFQAIYLQLKETLTDFDTYFGKLCELHKRRIKFKQILETQSFTSVESVVPRCLLEYGLMPSETLAAWLVWRKWLYDIDNRSAQETGYLFEPILAAAIGGVPYSAKVSPIKRADKPGFGRQVDCLDGKFAYEFKMRVTAAASGQGRFKEELDFARDCRLSSPGFIPVLLVLDPSSSTRLNDLVAEFSNNGGSAYIGNDAWVHIEQKAGTVMARFVEKYVRTPLLEVQSHFEELSSMNILNSTAQISVQIGDQGFSILRSGHSIDYEEPDTSIAMDE